jgi:hypothetical protein
MPEETNINALHETVIDETRAVREEMKRLRQLIRQKTMELIDAR